VDITPTMLMENKDQERWLNLKMRAMERLERESGYSPRNTLDSKRQRGMRASFFFFGFGLISFMDFNLEMDWVGFQFRFHFRGLLG
jgi:hypothetical protein